MKAQPVILLTGCIQPRPDLPFTYLVNPDERKTQYISAIHYYLNHYPMQVVFAENSGHDLSPDFIQEIQSGRLEILTFEGNDYPAELGKGPGEFNCILYAVENSRCIAEAPFVIKITGRYEVRNLNRFVHQWKRSPGVYVMAETRAADAFSDARCVGFKPEFIQNYLQPLVPELNDSAGVYFEHVLYRAIGTARSDHKKIMSFFGAPWIFGIAGSMNQPYRSGWLRHMARDIRQKIRYWRNKN